MLETLISEFHPTKNTISFEEFLKLKTTDKIKIWWICGKNKSHEWETKYNSRVSNKSNCPYCYKEKRYTVNEDNCLMNVRPDIAKEWHPTLNKVTPYDVRSGNIEKYWWKCENGEDHEWFASIIQRTRTGGNGCPICSGKKTVFSTSLEGVRPDIAKEWHPTKNGDLKPSDVTYRSGRDVWWKCEKGEDHEWKTDVWSRTQGIRCPMCASYTAVVSNSLGTLNPQLSKEWHPTKNGGLTPFDVVPGSAKKIWWKCVKGIDHEWKSTVCSRNNGIGCPICSNAAVVPSNCFANNQPELMKEWNYDLNTIDPYEISNRSTFPVWWKCLKNKDHVWKTTPNSRVSNLTRCPFCSNDYKGEYFTANHLNSKSIENYRQFSFKDCKNINVLKFDFRVIYNKIAFMLEFHGPQHDRPVSVFGGLESFLYTQKCDKIKEDYCLKNNIPLLIIKYKDMKNIPTIIDNYIANLPNI